MNRPAPSDLLAAALPALPDAALLTGYRPLTAQLAMNLPRGHQARLSAAPGGTGLLVESDLPEWLSIEAPLPHDARSAFVTLTIRADRVLTADLFLRLQDEGGRLTDGPITRLTLGDTAPAEALLPAPDATGLPRAIILLRAPPAELSVTTLRLE